MHQKSPKRGRDDSYCEPADGSYAGTGLSGDELVKIDTFLEVGWQALDYMCMCVFVCVCACVRVCVCICVYVYMCVYVYSCVYVYVYVYMYVYMYVHVRAYVDVYYHKCMCLCL